MAVVGGLSIDVVVVKREVTSQSMVLFVHRPRQLAACAGAAPAPSTTGVAQATPVARVRREIGRDPLGPVSGRDIAR